MAIARVTQNMLSQRSLGALQSGLGRLSSLQQQLSSGKVLTRPSDSPTGTVSAMRLRDSIATTAQYQRNADDGLAWLGVSDNAIGAMTDLTRSARDAGLQGANSGAMDRTSQSLLADQVDGLRTAIVGSANTTYLGRPVFGGVTAGPVAYADSGAYVGTPGSVDRVVGDGVSVRVDTDGRSVLGPDGDSVLDHLSSLSTALRAGDAAGISAATEKVGRDLDRMAAAHAEVGTRYQRVEQAQQTAQADTVRLKKSLSDVEDADLPETIVSLQMQQSSYQAALSATAKVLQPSLTDFLR